MKKITTIIALAFTFYPLAGDLCAQASKASLAGVWKYEREGWEGIAIFSPTHFIWVITDKNRQKFTSEAPAVSEKARAYEAINAATGTWELESNSRAKSTFLYASNPDRKGNFVRYDFELVGDEFTYWIIQPDGSRGFSGKYRKLADWGASSNISMLNGVWEYTGQNGMYLQAGNYGAWLIQNEEQPNASTDEGKAKNFDVINSSAVIGTHIEGNRHVWNIVHSKDVRNEKDVYFTNCEMINPETCSMWFINSKGVQVGDKWQVKRIGK
jgi:hypothetical protein